MLEGWGKCKRSLDHFITQNLRPEESKLKSKCDAGIEDRPQMLAAVHRACSLVIRVSICLKTLQVCLAINPTLNPAPPSNASFPLQGAHQNTSL